MDTLETKEVVVERESGSNTVLIVIILVIIVGLAVLWFTSHQSSVGGYQNTEAPASGVNVELNLPATNVPSSSGTPSDTSGSGAMPSYQ